MTLVAHFDVGFCLIQTQQQIESQLTSRPDVRRKPLHNLHASNQLPEPFVDAPTLPLHFPHHHSLFPPCPYHKVHHSRNWGNLRASGSHTNPWKGVTWWKLQLGSPGSGTLSTAHIRGVCRSHWQKGLFFFCCPALPPVGTWRLEVVAPTLLKGQVFLGVAVGGKKCVYRAQTSDHSSSLK